MQLVTVRHRNITFRDFDAIFGVNVQDPATHICVVPYYIDFNITRESWGKHEIYTIANASGY